MDDPKKRDADSRQVSGLAAGSKEARRQVEGDETREPKTLAERRGERVADQDKQEEEKARREAADDDRER